MKGYSVRRSTVDDIESICALENSYDGDRALWSLPIIRWGLFDSPFGPADSWVVEYREGGAEAKIVGHHAILGFKAFHGDREIRIGKTVKSILDKEHRKRFHYLRFEKNCLEEIKNKYDMIFSTQPGALKMRRVIGYSDGYFLRIYRKRFNLFDIIYNIYFNKERRDAKFIEVKDIDKLYNILKSLGISYVNKLSVYKSIEFLKWRFDKVLRKKFRYFYFELNDYKVLFYCEITRQACIILDIEKNFSDPDALECAISYLMRRMIFMGIGRIKFRSCSMDCAEDVAFYDSYFRAKREFPLAVFMGEGSKAGQIGFDASFLLDAF